MFRRGTRTDPGAEGGSADQPCDNPASSRGCRRCTRVDLSWSFQAGCEQATALLDHVNGDPLYAPLFIALSTGLRLGELLPLQWNDLDLRAKPPTLRVRDSKTKAGRRVLSLPPSAVEVLRAHRAEQAALALATGPAWQDEGYVFASSIGTQWNSANFRHRFQKACVEAGIGHWTPHELRHTAATWLITGGIGLKVIADQLGHSGISVTADVYGHLFGPSAEVADILGSILPTPSRQSA